MGFWTDPFLFVNIPSIRVAQQAGRIPLLVLVADNIEYVWGATEMGLMFFLLAKRFSSELYGWMDEMWCGWMDGWLLPVSSWAEMTAQRGKSSK